MEITSIEFQYPSIESINSDNNEKNNWPVVYILDGKKEVYVGETCNIKNRLFQHLKNKSKKNIKMVSVVYDKRFNKSVTLDIEQGLIRLFDADKKYTLLNQNSGQSPEHNYYNRYKYKQCVPTIWKELQNKNLANTSYDELTNSIFFKYSPYTSLNPEQRSIESTILSEITEELSKDAKVQRSSGMNFVIEGGAGTGKTIMALCILNLLQKIKNGDFGEDELDFGTAGIGSEFSSAKDLFLKKDLKIGFVVPMTSLRETIKKVANKAGLKGTIIGPFDAAREGAEKKYDVLIVDEAHRLTNYEGSINKKWFKIRSKNLGFKEEDIKRITQLDWIIRSSKCRIMFYDKEQSIKTHDIADNYFRDRVGESAERFVLTSQMRCLGGNPFVDYIKSILDCDNPKRVVEFENDFELRIFDDANDMIERIKNLNEGLDLCRVVAGYSWKWRTKGKDSKWSYDIEFGDKQYSWNKENEEWILREDSIDEIGCIHTSQGYDLNYVGVIFGKEIDYDPDKGKITIKKEEFYDSGVKNNSTDEDLKRHVINAYKVMLTRGIHGCYLYACNPNLHDYLQRYIKNYAE